MRIVPKSLFGRLLAVAALSTLAALAFAAVSIGHELERFVIHGLDQQLDAEVAMLARAVRADGTLDRARVVDLPAFDDAASGWRWQVRGERGAWSNGGAIDLPPPRREREHDDGEPRPRETRDAAGLRLHVRQAIVDTAAGPVSVSVSGPRAVAIAPLREAMVPLFASLALLGAGLAAATLLQLRFGLRPLRDLAAALAEVRSGRRRHVPADQPTELAALASELNALIDQNEAGLAHARRHVSNLAHGLKTPLAALALRLGEQGRDPDGALADMVAQIDARVRHHLGRARAVAPGGGQRVRTPLAPAVADLVAVLTRVHADRGVGATIAVADHLVVAVDAQDLDEMVGNLLDNAWRHARATVAVRGAREGASVVLTIDDDGAGLGEAAIAEALVPGRRLDERGDGHGFGLPITVELAEMNGGGLTLGASPTLGGLSARLVLPAGR